jgi:hypothetical protein
MSKFYKITGIGLGISSIFLSIFWGKDPAAGSILLLFIGVLLMIGMMSRIVNREMLPIPNKERRRIGNEQNNRNHRIKTT